MKSAIRTIASIGMLFAIGPESATSVHAQAEESSLKIMTFNILHGGTKRGQPLSQTAKAIQKAEADIVGLQEVGKNAEKLAKLLDWNYVSHGWSAILTRYEILERLDGGIKVKLTSDQEAYIFNLHLKPAPYQPYQLLGIRYGNAPFIKTEAEAVFYAKKARGGQIAKLLKQLKSLPDKEAPVFVTGDFNEPSHLDWTEKAAKSGQHPIKVAYPSSLAMAKAGFTDAWRSLHPDEIMKPGFTWSPVTQADDPKDHHDRIDYVYFRGKGIQLNEVKVVGEDKENADIIVSPYPSDHRAVVASFTLSSQSNSDERNANKPDASDDL